MKLFGTSPKSYIIDISNLTEQGGFIRVHFLVTEIKSELLGLKFNTDEKKNYICRDKFGNTQSISKENIAEIQKKGLYLSMDIPRNGFSDKYFPLWDRFKHGEKILEEIEDALDGYKRKNEARIREQQRIEAFDHDYMPVMPLLFAR